ncbi:uncharacterized protein LOC144477823, partial [Augochlora pura]
LTDVQRLRYLHISLEGEARAAIAHLPIDGKNFNIAWEALKETFGLECVIVADLIRQILKLKPIHDGDLASIQQVTVHAKQMMAALTAMGFPQDNSVTVQFIVDKLDRDLKLVWERTRGNRSQFPSLKELMEFLNDRAKSLIM